MTTQSDPNGELHLPTPRDVIAPLFRFWRTGLLVAVGVMAAAFALILTAPPQYEAEMKILVKRERADSIVSADPTAVRQVRTEVTEDELNSEVELLKSRDLLEEVAVASGLVKRPPAAGAQGRSSGRPVNRTASAAVVKKLESDLKIAPIRRTTFIKVSYRSPDPRLSARVLDELATSYLEKHRELHRAAGAYEFFAEQTARFRAELASAEARLTSSDDRSRTVSPEYEQQTTLQKMSDFEASLQEARARIAESSRRIADIEAQIATTPARQTTQIRTSENAELTRQLKSRILELETKRTEMLRKFKPDYPPVLQLEEELSQARSALEANEQSPLVEHTTDQNPTYQWLSGELVRVRSERAASVARATALEQSVASFREKARELEQMNAEQQSLRRAMKSAEERYLLYERKQEEARISDALDRSRIANVVVADAAKVPTLPANTARTQLLVLGVVLALALGAGAAYLRQYLAPYFYTPDDVERLLDVPVLATLPSSR